MPDLSRNFKFDEELEKLPKKPGVYIMRDRSDVIIYIGKAKVLHNRVRSYFRANIGRGPAIDNMVKQIAYFEYIVTDTELEARLADAAGMPVDDYLAQYGPRLLPTADALRALYEGSGSYQIDGVHLRFEGLDDARYLADDVLLVLEFVDRTEVYRRA